MVHVFEDSLMNRKFKRTAFIWNRFIFYHEKNQNIWKVGCKCFIHQSIYTCLYGPNWWHLTISYIHINGHVSHDIDCCVTLLSFLYMPCFHIGLEVRITSVWPPSCNPCFSVEIWGHKPLIICSYINRCVCAASLSDDWTELQWCSPPWGWTNKLQGDYRSHSCGESIKGYCIQGPKAPQKCVD